MSATQSELGGVLYKRKIIKIFLVEVNVIAIGIGVVFPNVNSLLLLSTWNKDNEQKGLTFKLLLVEKVKDFYNK